MNVVPFFCTKFALPIGRSFNLNTHDLDPTPPKPRAIQPLCLCWKLLVVEREVGAYSFHNHLLCVNEYCRV